MRSMTSLCTVRMDLSAYSESPILTADRLEIRSWTCRRAISSTRKAPSGPTSANGGWLSRYFTQTGTALTRTETAGRSICQPKPCTASFSGAVPRRKRRHEFSGHWSIRVLHTWRSTRLAYTRTDSAWELSQSLAPIALQLPMCQAVKGPALLRSPAPSSDRSSDAGLRVPQDHPG